MTWKRFGGATFTGAFTPHIDPYLTWADATAFADFSRTQAPPADVPVLLKLAAGQTAGALRACLPAGTLVNDWPGSAFCTARLPPAACRNARLQGVIERFQMCLPVLPERPLPRVPQAVQGQGTRMQARAGTSVLLGVIDTGCPFANRRFCANGSTRILNLWDQDPAPAFAGVTGAGQPPDFGYGREVSRDGLDGLMAAARRGGSLDEDACYEAAGLPELRRRATHGAHVLDQLAGPVRLGQRLPADRDSPPTWQTADDLASQADIVFVQLPRDALQDTSGQGLALHLLDGIRYILSCAPPHIAEVIVTISYAMATGPHDGSSLFEEALDELMHHERRLTVVLATGNDFARRGHACFGIEAGTPRSLALVVPAGSEASTLVELWLPESNTDVRLEVTPPGGTPGTLGRGTQLFCDGASPADVMAVLTGPAVAARGQRTLFLLAIAPTLVQGTHRRAAPAGVWRIELHSKAGVRDDAVDATIARSQTELGMTSRARQAWWLDPAYDPRRYLRWQALDTADTGVVRRMGTLSGLATGSQSRAVAGYRLSDLTHASYSSAGKPQVAGGPTTKLPDVAMVSEESPSLPGIRGAGSRSGCVVRLSGTSFAAPQWARHLSRSSLGPPIKGPPPDTRHDPTQAALFGAGPVRP